ncbi:hypothetical protein FXV83_16015 [Bradyrhizobium hipponense]|uniref:Nitrogen fixation protein NifZ n=1 Tax=Bradyrhizobium hipponense TaxID=2605638 RepID=A0A5S4YWV9_9BRAD|nr:hypothetical protein [Bradyrhizobium hipponense]TYO65439.1 hypothetical protein FXV83_16015 [Bradyrhizobium hipponense]
MVSRPFDHRHGLPEAEGFKLGQRVTMLDVCVGDDHEDNEHTILPGADGIIECIEMLAPPQGLTFTVWIPVNEMEGRGIVNVFDQGDGPITNFIKSKESP